VLGNVVLKGYEAGSDAAEVGCRTGAAARNRGIASHAVEMLTTWAFESFGAQGLQRIELLHQADNPASCRVAQKSGSALIRVLPARQRQSQPNYHDPGARRPRRILASPSRPASW
jgi:RimJ/RimL family protein N-acetyltransferase